MQGDFTGMATATAPIRMLKLLAEGVLETGKRVRVKVQARNQRRRLALAPISCAAVVAAALDDAVSAGRLASSTARKYRNVIVQFVAGMDPVQPVPGGPNQVERFLDERELQGIGRGARRVDLAALRTVFDKLLGNDVTLGFTYPARPNPVPANQPWEVAKMLEMAADERDRLILLLLNAVKLRPGQIASLKLAQIDLMRGVVTVPKRKSGEFIEAVLPEDGRKLLVDFIAGRDTALHGSQWVFESPCNPDEHLSVRAIQKRLRKMAENCGVEATPTMLRKADSLWMTLAARPASRMTTTTMGETARPKVQGPPAVMPVAVSMRHPLAEAASSVTRYGLPRDLGSPASCRHPVADITRGQVGENRRTTRRETSGCKKPPPKWEAHQRRERACQ